MPRYLDPKNDFTFKKIFGNNPNLLKSFLNAVLPLPEDCLIESLTYLSSENLPRTSTSKTSIVDVRCYDNHGRHFIVEMQVRWTNNFFKRMIFNAASAYVKQIDKGENYEQLSSVYELAVLNTIFDKEEEAKNQWFHHYRLTSAHDGKKNWDDIQCVLIELPKFTPTSITEKKLAVLWLRFLKEIKDKTEIIDPSLLEVEEIRKAVDLLEESAYSKEDLLVYDKYWDTISTEKTLISDNRNEAKAEGKAEGLAEGEAKGKAEVVLNMHRLGLPTNQISEFVKLSPKQIEIILAAQTK